MTEFDVSMGASPCLCFSVCDFHLIWSSLPCRSTGMQDDLVFLLDESHQHSAFCSSYVDVQHWTVTSINWFTCIQGGLLTRGQCCSQNLWPRVLPWGLYFSEKETWSPVSHFKAECPLSALCRVNLFLKCYMLSQISLKLMSCHLFF